MMKKKITLILPTSPAVSEEIVYNDSIASKEPMAMSKLMKGYEYCQEDIDNCGWWIPMNHLQADIDELKAHGITIPRYLPLFECDQMNAPFYFKTKDKDGNKVKVIFDFAPLSFKATKIVQWWAKARHKHN